MEVNSENELYAYTNGRWIFQQFWTASLEAIDTEALRLYVQHF